MTYGAWQVAAGAMAVLAGGDSRADDASSTPVADAGAVQASGADASVGGSDAATNGTGWALTLDDEFDETSLDLCRWQLRHKWGERVVNNERQAYVNAEHASEAFTLDNGILHIVARKQTGVYGGLTQAFTSGLLVSVQNQRYGYYEIRSRMPSGSGLWPAFWLLHTPGHPDIHEIDITEWVSLQPNVVLMTDHYGTSYQANSLQAQFTFSAPDLTSAFHVFGLDWEADRIVWYADGTEMGRATDPGQLHDTEMYVIANLAVGGDLPGTPAPGAVFPASYDLDYIRVYKRDGTRPDAAPPFGPTLSVATLPSGAGGQCSALDAGPFDAEAGPVDAEAGPVDGEARAPADATEEPNLDAPDAPDSAAVILSPSGHNGCGCSAVGSGADPPFAVAGAGSCCLIALGRRKRRSKHPSSHG